ncbi:craniofacial development protein 2-like [Saccostrea echinata]|uniref:craniofacial development protein 2-like n=1 Tax=Saccostrea echinata TaxID=191078 RepID=UPI002A8236BD|nr:craniofacial development protein 2-like [Saccostrea echinata]
MFQIGRKANIVREFNRYKLDIMGVSKVRWTGFVELKTTSGETILYSGAEEHHRGVGLILSRKSRQSLMEWNPVNDRFINARFFSRFTKLTLIQIYSPTNEADEGHVL